MSFAHLRSHQNARRLGGSYFEVECHGYRVAVCSSTHHLRGRPRSKGCDRLPNINRLRESDCGWLLAARVGVVQLSSNRPIFENTDICGHLRTFFCPSPLAPCLLVQMSTNRLS